MCTVLTALCLAGAGVHSDVKSDETVVFFPTIGWLDESASTWHVFIHGWVFEPEADSIRRALLLRVLVESLDLDEDSARAELFRERARDFLVDNESGKSLFIRLGGRVYPAGVSGKDGHFAATLNVPVQHLDPPQTAGDRDRWLTYSAVLPAGDPRRFEGRVCLLAPAGLSVITDVDDTVKVTNVGDRRELLANTFVRPFRPVEGMREMFGRWTGHATFHYVSASPWQLYRSLSVFVEAEGFPPGTWHLKPFRAKDRSFRNLFADPFEYKLEVIGPILRQLPRRRFILVGDSGEKDPEAYGELARRHPRQIQQIIIRDVGGPASNAERFRAAFANVPPDRWHILKRPTDLDSPAAGGPRR